MNMSPEDASDSMDDMHNRIVHLDMDEPIQIAVESVKSNIDHADELYEPRVESIYDDGHPLLNKTGRMREGVQGEVRVSGDGFDVDISDEEEYGAYIDQGTSRMVSRPFMIVGDVDLDRIENIIADQMLGDE